MAHRIDPTFRPEEIWKEIETLAQGTVKETVEIFYHVTNKKFEPKIGEPYSKTLDEEIKGVWFCPTKYQGELPPLSPYGSHRIKIPIKDIITDDHHLFCDSAYHYDDKDQHVRFVLVKKEPGNSVWECCKRNLHHIDLKENSIFTYNQSTAKCVENRADDKIHFWIEVLIVGDVSLMEKGEWDSVKHTLRRGKFKPGVLKKERELLLKKEKEDLLRREKEDSTYLYNEAMKEGHVTIRTTNVLLFGMAGTGKTTTKHLILGLPPPQQRNSTPLADLKDRVLIRDIAATKIQVGKDSWRPVTIDDLKKHIADLIHTHPRNHPEKQVATLEENGTSMDHEESSSMLDEQKPPTPEAKHELHKPVSDVADEIQFFVQSDSRREVLGSNWIYLIDSGGQPHFHNLLPLFLQGISLAIYIFRLSDKLDDFPLVEYYKNDKPLGKAYKPLLTTRDNFKYLVQSMQSQAHSRESKVICVGTHYDVYKSKECVETLEQKNSSLHKMLPESIQNRTVFHKLGKNEIIFPVNAKLQSPERDEIMKRIQEKITEQQPSEIKVPLWWYVFEISIEKISREQSKKLFSIEECRAVASEFNVGEDALVEALTFFHKHHIFHYYPDVLPEVVFCDTQVLLSMITELVEYATGIKECKILDINDGVWIRFINRGIINEKFLALLNEYYIANLFGPIELLKVFEHLLIAAKCEDDNNETEYYMPSLLNSLSISELDKKRTSLLRKSSPLAIRFDDDWPHCGVFCCLQVYLTKVCKWQLSKNEKPTQNVVTMRLRSQPFLVTLVDLIRHIEVFVSCTVPSASTPCPYTFIRDKIHSGIQSACKTLQYDNVKVENVFLCPQTVESEFQDSVFSSTDCHLALVLDRGFMRCTQTDMDYPLNKQQEKWLAMTDQVHDGYMKCTEDHDHKLQVKHSLPFDQAGSHSGLDVQAFKRNVHFVWDHLMLFKLKKDQQGEINGDGIAIAILDTGVDPDHVAIKDNIMLLDNQDLTSITYKDDNHKTLVAGVPFTYKNDNHGTSVAGVAAGKHLKRSECAILSEEEIKFEPDDILRIGVAPKASLVIFKVTVGNKNDLMQNYKADEVIKALQEIINHNNKKSNSKKIELIVMPFQLLSKGKNSKIEQLLEELVRQNVLCLASAGNQGHATGLGYPATSEKVLTIGASTTYCDVPPFSAEAVKVTKEVISILGEGILAPVALIENHSKRPNCFHYPPNAQKNNCLLDTVTGTSYSAPAMAGLIAILLQLDKRQGIGLDKEKDVVTRWISFFKKNMFSRCDPSRKVILPIMAEEFFFKNIQPSTPLSK